MDQTEGKAEHAWDLMEKIGVAMFVTHGDGDGMRARPMAAHVKPDENAIYFLTDADAAKDHEVDENAAICIAFSDPKANKFVSVSGEAQVTNDRAKIKDLWSTWAKAYWDSADDPSIRLLRVTPESAEYWDAPGRAVAFVKMAAAAVSSTRPHIGENAKVKL